MLPWKTLANSGILLVFSTYRLSTIQKKNKKKTRQIEVCISPKLQFDNFFSKKLICQIIAYNANYAQFLSIMNIKGIDCTNQYFFTLRKRICHGKWHDSKRTILICWGNQRSLSFILAPQSFICVYHDLWEKQVIPRQCEAFYERFFLKPRPCPFIKILSRFYPNLS